MQYGTLIYIGDRIADLELMEDELRELYDSKILDAMDFKVGILIVRQAIEVEKEKRRRNE